MLLATPGRPLTDVIRYLEFVGPISFGYEPAHSDLTIYRLISLADRRRKFLRNTKICKHIFATSFGIWPHRLAARTPGSHPGNRGSIPREVTIFLTLLFLFIFKLMLDIL